jgi:2'-5' RNA ligase
MTRLTYGVAIAVPEPHGTLLREMRASFGDQMARTVPSHVTLLPPAEVDAEELDEICARLDKAAGDVPSFRVRLQGTGTFRPVSPVVYVRVIAGYVATAVLAGQLRQALGAPRPEFPFHPHVTVAHHLDDAALDRADESLHDFECEFEVEEFAFYLHDDIAGWQPQRSFSLAPMAPWRVAQARLRTSGNDASSSSRNASAVS